MQIILIILVIYFINYVYRINGIEECYKKQTIKTKIINLKINNKSDNYNILFHRINTDEFIIDGFRCA